MDERDLTGAEPICIPSDSRPAPNAEPPDHPDPASRVPESAVITEDPDAPVTIDVDETDAAEPESTTIAEDPDAPVTVDDTESPSSEPQPAVISDDPDAPVTVDDSAAAGLPEQLLISEPPPEQDTEELRRLAVLEAIVYVTDEPLSAEQIANAMGAPLPEMKPLLDRLVAEYNRPEHGLTVREVAGGYKMTTKPEHHEAVRNVVKNLNPPLKLSLAALETLAVIAYKQPITAPEIMEIRGVQGAGVLKTLVDRKLISTAGRKNVVGKPILYRTTKEFLVQFGLRDLSELPTLKEFEDLRRMAFSDSEDAAGPSDATDGVRAASPMPEETGSAGPEGPASTAHE